jgi:hypothetical protein
MVVNLISRVGTEEDAMSDGIDVVTTGQRSLVKVIYVTTVMVVLVIGGGVAAALIAFLGKTTGAIILAVTTGIISLLIAGGISLYGFLLLKIQKKLFS